MARKKLKIKKVKNMDDEIKNVRNLLSHIEDEYRKANISNKSYEELKEKYTRKLEKLTGHLKPQADGGKKKKGDGLLGKILGKKKKKEEEKPEKKVEKKGDRIEPGEIEEVTPEMVKKLAEQMAGDEGVSADDVETDEEPDKLKEPEEAAAEASGSSALVENKLRIELEKLKVMIDAIRESKHVSDETIQTISETIGEMRSMIFQADATLKETLTKMERLEDEVTGVKPQEMSKKFREINDNFEKMRLEIEKLQIKTSSQTERLNQALEMLKSLGGVENLLGLNKKIQERLDDVKEAEKYIERIGNKIEKMYIDLSRGIEDLVLIRAKQEDFENGLKDMVKSMDGINVKLGNYVTKKDMESYREDIIIIKKHLEEVDKILPIAELKLPESIISLRKEREDIKIFLSHMEEQYQKGEVEKEEYESIKNGNMKKLDEMSKKIKEEWKKMEGKLKKPETSQAESVELLELPKGDEAPEGAEEQKTEEAPQPEQEEQPKQKERPEQEASEEEPKKVVEKKKVKKKPVKEKVKEEAKEEPKPKKKVKKSKPRKAVKKAKKKKKPKKKKVVKRKKKKKLTESQRKKRILSSLRR